MRIGLVGLAFAAAVIAGTWAWLGAPVAMSNASLSRGEKLWCVSYAPYRGTQTPYDPNTHIARSFAITSPPLRSTRTWLDFRPSQVVSAPIPTIRGSNRCRRWRPSMG